MKRKFFITSGIILFILMCTLIFKNHVLLQTSPSLSDYTAYPPFITEAAAPNVLIVLDNSGSMYEFAYKTAGTSDSTSSPDASFNSSETYYGYFNPSSKYSYSSGGYFYQSSSGSWSGNFLNWLTMRRIDVVRKVLVGGKAENRANTGTTKYLIAAENPDRNYYKRNASAGSYTPFSSDRCFRVRNNGTYEAIFVSSYTNGTCGSFTAGTISIKLEVGLEEPLGVIQKTWDRIRFGLMFFNNYGNRFEDGASGRDGGYVSDWIAGPGANVNLVTNIENTNPSTWTPLAESFYEATRYFRAGTGAYQSVNYAAHDPINEWCQKNFALILTDGESTKDRNIPGGAWVTPVSDPDGFNVKTYMDSIASNEGYSSQWNVNANTSQGTYYLEGIAYWARVTDLRSDLEGTQNLTTYAVFAFDESAVGKDLLKKTAKYGAFEDRNNNNIPDLPSEWDADDDGNPDTYFEAGEGEALETALVNALASILNRTSSGTAVSVLATTGEGEGAIYQAYFYPKKLEGTEERRWLGYIHALFIDEYGNLREDTNGDQALSLIDDYIIQTEYDPDEGTLIKRYWDKDGNGEIEIDKGDVYLGKSSIDNISSIWNGGKRLWDMNPSDRTIFTTTDGYSRIDFKDTKKSDLRPYLRATDDTESGNIINYIRGTDTGYRKRTVTIGGQTKVWKLGDIVYSTPTAVAKPMENYDLLYGDASYSEFRLKYINRRHVVYVGANDGMLHAFNGGFYDTVTRKFTGDTYALGDEMWAFIPRELLPHLKWLTDPDYTHVYYVDLKPKVTDAKIFRNDTTHPNGWGTILIGGMRYGGKPIPTEVGTLRSTYFALDITAPESPRLLWTFDTTDSGATDLGLTMSYPAVVRVENEWYVVVGSGPTNFDSLSNLTGFQEGKIFVLKISGGSNGVIDSWTLNSNYWKISQTVDSKTFLDAFMSSPTTIDVNTDSHVDVAYIGVNYKQSGNKEASMLRLTTKKTTSISSWELSELYNIGDNDLSKRINTSPSAALDNRGRLWIYFGTGQFLGVGDRNQSDTGAFYGVKDGCWNGSCSSTYSNLLDVTDAVVLFGGGTVQGVSGASNWTELLNTIYVVDGWAIYFGDMPSTEYVEFQDKIITHKGERVTTKPAVLGGLVMFTTYIPGEDICTIEGESNLYVLYYQTGTAYRFHIFRAEKGREKVSRVAYLGKGLPASIGLAVTKRGEIKGFVQSSTGDIQPIQELDPTAPRSGYTGWKAYGLQ